MSDCGPPCAELITRAGARKWQFHLEVLKLSIPDCGESRIGEAYKASGYRGKKRTLVANAARLIGTDSMRAALKYHRDQDAEKFSAEKETALKQLSKIAASGSDSDATAGEAVRAISTQAKILGWNEPERHSFTVEDIQDLARRAKAGDEGAAKQLRDRHRELRGER